MTLDVTMLHVDYTLLLPTQLPFSMWRLWSTSVASGEYFKKKCSGFIQLTDGKTVALLKRKLLEPTVFPTKTGVTSDSTVVVGFHVSTLSQPMGWEPGRLPSCPPYPQAA